VTAWREQHARHAGIAVVTAGWLCKQCVWPGVQLLLKSLVCARWQGNCDTASPNKLLIRLPWWTGNTQVSNRIYTLSLELCDTPSANLHCATCSDCLAGHMAFNS
jgi:hypothetical protein